MIRMSFVAVAASMLLFSRPSSAFADRVGAPMLRLVDAQAMAVRAERAAAEKGLNVSVVIVNREGRVILSHRMDGSSFPNLALAESKAATAAAIGAPSALLEQAVDAGKPSLLSVPGAAFLSWPVTGFSAGSASAAARPRTTRR